MKVKEMYLIDEDLLEEKADGNSYWQKCAEFWLDVRDKDAMNITEKQRAWLSKIQEDLKLDDFLDRF